MIDKFFLMLFLTNKNKLYYYKKMTGKYIIYKLTNNYNIVDKINKPTTII